MAATLPSLPALVRDFDRDAAAYRKRISEFLQYSPESFYASAIEVLKRDTESRGAQFIVGLLVTSHLLFRALCDPAIDLNKAVTLAQQAMRFDPMVDATLARQLADASLTAAGENGSAMAERLMEILEKVSSGSRIVPALMRVLRNDNPYLRSKAVLMIGRGGKSLTWIQKRLEESDTRVRANAVESLWGMGGDEARELLGAASRDSNNRVAGNGLLGLYLMGDSPVLPELIRMSGHDSAPYRRTAAWVMGETGDPRFTEVLGRMLSDPHGDVRKNAFAALGKIRSLASQAAETNEWSVAGIATSKDPRRGHRLVSVAVIAADTHESPRVLPVQFHLSENGEPVWAYRVKEKPVPEAMAVIFTHPRTVDQAGKAWDRGAQRCLEWKRPQDLWCAIPYAPDAASRAAADQLELPQFIARSSHAARSFEEVPKRSDCTGFWNAMRRAIEAGSNPARGKCHIIALAPVDLGALPDPTLVTTAHGSRISFHVISASANPHLREFCGRVNGTFSFIERAEEIEDRISQTYLGLLARYEIRYQPVCPDAPNLKLSVHTPAGWGEALIRLPS